MTLINSVKISLFYIFIFFVLVFLSIYINHERERRFFKQSYEFLNKQKTIDDLQNIINNTTAEGVIVYDLKNDRILGEKNVDKTYSLASITKIMTAYLVYEKDTNSLNRIREMLKTSNNQEAEKLTDIFSASTSDKMDYINQRVAKYNLFFRNSSGLDIEKDLNKMPGGEGKPKDVIRFIRDYYIKYPEVFDQTIIEDNNTNIIVKDLKFLSGGKTGFTALSGGNLFVSIQKGLGREIFVLVLNSTEKNRFVDVQNIVNFLIQSNI